jgi:hypothetical protein
MPILIPATHLRAARAFSFSSHAGATLREARR